MIVIVFMAVYGAFIHSRAFSANSWSRLGAIESLVERGTWSLDESAFVKSIDKIQVDGRFYSDKPPMMAFLGSGVYALVHHGFGLSLQAQGCEPDFDRWGCLAWERPAEADWAYYSLVLLLVCLPAAGMLALLFHVTQRQGWSVGMGLLLVVTLGVGTGVWPYSTVFTNHVPAAVCLFAAVYLLLQESQPRNLALAGFLVTLAAALDLSAAIYVLVMGGYVLLYQRPYIFYFVGGCLPPGLLSLGLNYAIVGNLLPPQMYTEGYQYAGSRFGASVAGNQTADSPLYYAQRMLFGDRGVFAFYPVLLIYVLGVVQLLRTADERVRRIGWLVVIGTLGYLSYFVFLTDNFGGRAFGVRWLINPLPLLALLTALVPSWPRPPRWLPVSLLLLLLPSAWMGYRGALAPWQTDVPPMQLLWTRNATRPMIDIALSGYGEFDEIDPDIRASFENHYQRRRWFDVTQALVVPPQRSWWFIQPDIVPAAVFRERFALGAVVDAALYADLSPVAEAWIAEMSQAVYQDEELVPAAAPSAELLLPQAFYHPRGSMALRGFERTIAENQVAIVTAWQIVDRDFPTGERRVFIHLLNPAGEIVAQSDLLAGNYESFYSGDLFFQQQVLDVSGVSSGEYWVQMGVYEPSTGARLLVNGRDRLLLERITLE